jgi:hypothetical protein
MKQHSVCRYFLKEIFLQLHNGHLTFNVLFATKKSVEHFENDDNMKSLNSGLAYLFPLSFYVQIPFKDANHSIK